MYNKPAYKHKVYNPEEETLQDICDKEPMEIHWRLIKVIEVSAKERVALFVIND